VTTRVPGINQAEFTLRETAVVDAVIRGLNRVAEQQAARINATVITAAADDGPPGQPYISADDLGQISADWNAYTAETLLPLMEQTYLGSSVAWTLAVAQTVEGWDAAMIPAVSSLQAEDYLAGASNRLRGIGDELWHTSRAQLLEGFKAGETIPQLAARVQASAGVAEPRSLVIARTEVLGASNRGSWDTARLLGRDAPLKEWTATFDERTRQTHRDADNAYREGGHPGPIAIDEPFLVGGYSLMYPADPAGPVGEVASCRCTPTYVFHGDRPSRRAGGRAAPAAQAEPPAHGEAAKKAAGADLTPNPREAGKMGVRAGDPLPDDKAKQYFRDFRDYGGGGYKAINNSLRGKTVEANVAGQIARMDELFARAPLSADVSVWRGLDNGRLFGHRLGNDLTGFEWREQAYVSTGIRERTAQSFASTHDGSGVVMRILARKGTGSVDMGTFEDEVLLQRGLRARVVADHGIVQGPHSRYRLLDIEVGP